LVKRIALRLSKITIVSSYCQPRSPTGQIASLTTSTAAIYVAF